MNELLGFIEISLQAASVEGSVMQATAEELLEFVEVSEGYLMTPSLILNSGNWSKGTIRGMIGRAYLTAVMASRHSWGAIAPSETYDKVEASQYMVEELKKKIKVERLLLQGERSSRQEAQKEQNQFEAEDTTFWQGLIGS
ncbi:MAG: hypothetical protein Q9221_009117 [Calogaya cf. arnoldii]